MMNPRLEVLSGCVVVLIPPHHRSDAYAGLVVRPVHQVRAGRVRPVHPRRMVVGPVGIELVEEVVSSLPEEYPVRIAHVIRRRQEVVQGAIWVGREIVPTGVDVCGEACGFGHLIVSRCSP